MAASLKNKQGAGTAPGGTSTGVYTTPADYTSTIKRLVVALPDTATEQTAVEVQWEDTSAAGVETLATFSLRPGEQQVVAEATDFVLEDGDILHVYGDGTDVSLTVSEDSATTTVYRMRHSAPAVATIGNDNEDPCVVAPFAGTVTAVTYTPKAAITGVNTNTRKLSLINKGQAGAGTTEVAALQFNLGTDAAAYDEKTITLSVTEADRVVVAGDVLSWKSLHIGNGIADPGGLVTVTFTWA